MKYITISDIREFVMTGTVTSAKDISWDNDTASALLNSKGIPFFKINFPK